jgi:hypothetical protein
MKKIYLILLVLIGITISCTKNFEDFNTDKKRPNEVPGGMQFANSQIALADQQATPNVNLNIWRYISQYLTSTTYLDEPNYDIVTRNIAQLQFRTYYRDVLADLKQAKASIAAEEAITEEAIAVQSNRILIIDLVEVYVYQILVDIFGNIPYAQALDIENLNPKYDDALIIYKDLLTRVNADIAGLNDAYGSFGTDDVYYQGDVAMWKKFANTLKVRIAINLADVDNTLAKDAIEAAYAGAFAPGENCQLSYPGGTYSNPLYEEMVASGRHDFVAANTIIDKMVSLADPRLPFYFTMAGDTAYIGGVYGASSPYTQYSHVADPILEPTYPMVLLDYTELAFYLAEAAERDYEVGNTADFYYNYAIGSSIIHWGGTEADVIAYLSNPDVSYATAPGTWQEKIGTQAWIAYYLRATEGWTTWRRLDFPVLNLPPLPESDDGQIPKRFTYPTNEQTLNTGSYYEASSAIGGDLMSNKLFWDIH